MRIRIIDPAAPNTLYWIAGHPDYADAVWTGTDGLKWARTDQVQAKTGPGWESAKYCAAGNGSAVATCKISRAFTDPLDAAAALEAYLSATPPHPLEGTLAYRMDRADGTWRESLGTNAVVQMVEAYLDGVLTLRLSYRLSSGLLTTGDTGVDGALTTEDGALLTTEDGDILIA